MSSTTPSSSFAAGGWERASVALPIVLIVALIARLGYWLLVMPAADRGFVVDEPEYFAGAVVFASGRGFSFWDTFLWTRTPLYPATLGFTFQLFGHDSLLPARLLQLGLSLASIAVLYLLAHRALGPAVAFVSGLFAAFYLPFIILPYLLLGETLFILLFGLFLLAIIRFDDTSQRISFSGETEEADKAKSLSPAGRGLVRGEADNTSNAEASNAAPNLSPLGRGLVRGDADPTPIQTNDSQRIVKTDKRIGPANTINDTTSNSKLKTQNSKLGYTALAGLLLGLAMLVRGTALVYLPFAAFVLWLNLRSVPNSNLKSQISNLIAAFLLTAMLTLAPWTVRNYVAYGYIIPTDTTAGYNFWLGANRGLDGGRLAGDLLAIANQGARQNYAYARGFDLLRADPLGFVGKGLKEMNDLWAGNFSAEERFTQGYTHGLVPAAHLLASITLDDTLYLLLVPLAIVGLFAAPRHRLHGYVVAWALVNFALAFLFFAVVRFRLAVLFFLLPYAAWTLLNLRPLWRSLTALILAGRSRSRQKAPSGGLGEKAGSDDHVSSAPTLAPGAAGPRQALPRGEFSPPTPAGGFLLPKVQHNSWYKAAVAAILIVAFLIANLPAYPLAQTVQGVAAWGKQQHLAAGDELLASGDLAGAAKEYNQADQNLAETQTAQANLSVWRGDLKSAQQFAGAIDNGYWGRYLVLGEIARAQGIDPTVGFVNRVVRDNYAAASDWAWSHFTPTLQCDLHVGDEGQDMGSVHGFATAEVDGIQRYRWSVQPTTSLRLCPASPTSATLTMRLRGYWPANLTAPTVSVSVAGVTIGSVTVTTAWHDYRIAVPSAVVTNTSGGAILSLSSSTFVASGSDPQLRGFMLAEARWGGQ